MFRLISVKKYSRFLKLYIINFKHIVLQYTLSQNFVHDKIKRGLNSENLLSSHLLCKNLNIKICKTVILFYVGVKLCLWVLRRIFEPKREEVVAG
jgi:hypothetical protein